MQRRLEKFRSLLNEKGRAAALIMRPENRMYLSGFTGSAGYLFISRDKAFLLTDSRYTEQAREQAPYFTVVEHAVKWEDKLGEFVREAGVGEVVFEKDYVTYAQYQNLRDKLDTVGWIPEEGLVEKLRIIKDEQELTLLRQAVAMADQGYEHILGFIKPGRTEVEVAVELEFFLRRAGAEKAAFDFIVASGPRSSLPHGKASAKLIQAGEQVKMDFGAVFRGYHSDITRTVFMGKADAKFKEIYHIVLEAQERAIAAVAPGKTGIEIDLVARDFITAKGYGGNFGHGLGHGVGLMIHEGPRVSSAGDEVLEPGMILTVEPGIYLPGWGGVRIEDLVLVTATGCEILTKAPKTLQELTLHN